MKPPKNLDRSMIRALLIAQKGRCAISGIKIRPADVALDHIIPVSRKELSKKKGWGHGWLVHKKINAMKGTLTIDEIYELINMINKNKKKTKSILNKILAKKIKPVDKEIFDAYIKKNYTKDGLIKK